MTPKDVLLAAKERFFTTDCRDVSMSMAGAVDYPIYCRALFYLKRGMGCDPRDSLFEWQRSFEHVSLNAIRIGFDRAILAAGHD